MCAWESGLLLLTAIGDRVLAVGALTAMRAVQNKCAVMRAAPFFEADAVRALQLPELVLAPAQLNGTMAAGWLQALSLAKLQARVIILGCPIMGRRGMQVLDLVSGNLGYGVEASADGTCWRLHMRVHWPTAKALDGAGDNTSFSSAPPACLVP